MPQIDIWERYTSGLRYFNTSVCVLAAFAADMDNVYFKGAMSRIARKTMGKETRVIALFISNSNKALDSINLFCLAWKICFWLADHKPFLVPVVWYLGDVINAPLGFGFWHLGNIKLIFHLQYLLPSLGKGFKTPTSGKRVFPTTKYQRSLCIWWQAWISTTFSKWQVLWELYLNKFH